MAFRKYLKLAGLAGGIFCFTLPALAQHTYLKLGGTYNFGLGSSIPAYARAGTVNKDNSADFTITQHKVNLGEGWLFQAAAGHFFTENMGAELAFGMMPGKTHLIESSIYYAAIGATEGYDETYKPQLFMLQPALVVRMSPKTITPYGRLGFTLAKVTLEETKKNTFWTESREIENEYTGGLGFGFQGALGADFAANSQITFYSEVTLNSLSWAPQKRQMISYRENKQTGLDAVPPGERETNYTDEFTVKYDKNGDLVTANGASNDLKDYLPMNTIGLSVGIKYNF